MYSENKIKSYSNPASWLSNIDLDFAGHDPVMKRDHSIMEAWQVSGIAIGVVPEAVFPSREPLSSLRKILAASRGHVFTTGQSVTESSFHFFEIFRDISY